MRREVQIHAHEVKGLAQAVGDGEGLVQPRRFRQGEALGCCQRVAVDAQELKIAVEEIEFRPALVSACAEHHAVCPAVKAVEFIVLRQRAVRRADVFLDQQFLVHIAVLELGVIRPEGLASPGTQLLHGGVRVERLFVRADEVVAAAEVPLDGEPLRQRVPVDVLRPVVHGEQTVERAAAAAAVHVVAHTVFVRALAHDGVSAEALELLLEQLFVERLRVLQIRQTAELAQE